MNNNKQNPYDQKVELFRSTDDFILESKEIIEKKKYWSEKLKRLFPSCNFSDPYFCQDDPEKLTIPLDMTNQYQGVIESVNITDLSDKMKKKCENELIVVKLTKVNSFQWMPVVEISPKCQKLEDFRQKKYIFGYCTRGDFYAILLFTLLSIMFMYLYISHQSRYSEPWKVIVGAIKYILVALSNLI